MIVVCRCKHYVNIATKNMNPQNDFARIEVQFMVGAVKSFPFRKQSHWEHPSRESVQSLKHSSSGLSLEIQCSVIL